MVYPFKKFENEIILEIKKIFKDLNIENDIKLEIPPENMGDFALPCFKIAPVLKKSPKNISILIANKFKKSELVNKIETKSGYVNFFINQKILLNYTIKSILLNKEKYGQLEKKKKKVIIEHTSANPNGPLHVGRARNPIIGDTLVRLFRIAGYDVRSQFYLDDLGKQVAILTWGINNIDTKDIKKNDHEKHDHKYVIFYQEANKLMEKDERVLKEINNIIKKSEKTDEDTIKLVKKAYEKVLKGIMESLNRINIFIDDIIPESKFVKDKSVEKVIKKLKESEYCNEKDDAFYLDLEPFGIKGRNTNFYFIRKDGTSVYATRDIAYHLWKSNQADILVNILGEDHKLESKQVEISLKLLNVENLPKPVFYSFVSMSGGKMSTRHGRVVYLDNLIDECVKRAYNEVKKRRTNDLSKSKMKNISEIVGIGALRYNIIKVQPEKDIVFKWEEALNFEGNSSPFIQYAHARACSILLKYGNKITDYDTSFLKHNSETILVKKLARFPIMIKEACESFKPHLITIYLNDLASQFNQFYRDCPVISEENVDIKKARLALVDATRIVVKNGLELLGISAPKEM